MENLINQVSLLFDLTKISIYNKLKSNQFLKLMKKRVMYNYRQNEICFKLIYGEIKPLIKYY